MERHSSNEAWSGLRIHALGPMRIERRHAPINHLGGAKAGSRQAAGVFAFLYDRGQVGASKDEIVDLIWPDVDLDRADIAFHRTVLGIRQTLAVDGAHGPAILFQADRYRLHPALAVRSDVTEFERLVDGPTADPAQRIRDLIAAAELYRGDYLDDCPYYGDSAFVEQSRSFYRATMVDGLAELSDLFAREGNITAARRLLRRAALIGSTGETAGTGHDAPPRLGPHLAGQRRPMERAAVGP